MQSQNLASNVAESVRSKLGACRVSGSELARRLGVQQMYVHRRLTGEVEISLTDLERIAAALDVPLRELLPARHAA